MTILDSTPNAKAHFDDANASSSIRATSMRGGDARSRSLQQSVRSLGASVAIAALCSCASGNQATLDGGVPLDGPATTPTPGDSGQVGDSQQARESGQGSDGHVRAVDGGAETGLQPDTGAIDAGVEGGRADALQDGSDAGACSCAPLAPSGWSGPVLFNEAAEAPACSGLYGTTVFSGYSDPTAGAYVCPPGNCGSVVGYECNATLQWNHNLCAAVSGGCNTVSGFDPGVCTKSGAQEGSCAGSTVSSVTLVSVASAPGSCAAAVDQPPALTTPQTFGGQASACAPTTTPGPGSCSSSDVCLPDPGSSSVCIWSAGTVACPGAPYATQYLVYATDTFDTSSLNCTGYSCTLTGETTCETSGSVTVYTADAADKCGVAQDPISLSGPGACAATGGGITAGNTYSAIWQPTTGSAGTCAASGGTLEGAVKPPPATTFCCTH
jgi:hypothetical protein